MSAIRFGRRFTVAASVAGVLAAPLAVLATATSAYAAPVDVQILGTNDFHGRLLANGDEAGAAQFAGAVAQLRATNPNTLFAAGGDLIGASTFESFILKDKPTLDALNAAGLDVSAAGNHEFDAGYHDLTDRVMAPYDAVTNPYGGAEFQYLAANVRKRSDNTYALPDVAASPGTSDGGTWMATIGGVDVGFVGAVTEDLPALVSPDGIADVRVTDIVEEVNAGADALTAAGADLVVMLVHEGAATTDISSVTDDSAFGQIVQGVDSDVDAIISGHTHLAYNHVVDGRPVVSAGQYGTNLNKLVFTVDPETGSVALKENAIVKANDVALTDPSAIAVRDEVAGIVADARADSDVLGAEVLGSIANPFNRAKLANGTTENRGGESTLGNLVAEVQRWATSAETFGGAQIAFMNPGGLRADMVGNNAGGYPASLTYKQAALVQPFANTLVNMRMTGAQVKKLLEQQWQRDAAGDVPSRPFLRLGTSKGFKFTYDSDRPEGNRITGMWLDGQALDPYSTYSITANSFLAAGGDNFHVFREATGKRDSGKIDLETMVDYMADNSPVAADWTQHAVGVDFPADAPASYGYGDQIKFNLSSLAFSNASDLKDTAVEVRAGDVVLGTFPVDNTIGTAVFDEYGTAAVDVVLTPQVSPAVRALRVVGTTTGTVVRVPILIKDERNAATVAVTAEQSTLKIKKDSTNLAVTVTSKLVPTGQVQAVLKGRVIGAADLVNGKATIEVGPFFAAGAKDITVRYSGDNATKPASAAVTLTVQKARPRIKVNAPKRLALGRNYRPLVTVSDADVVVKGRVKVIVKKKGAKQRKVQVRVLKNGQRKFNIKKLKPGVHKVKVVYIGSPEARRVNKKLTLRVRR